MNIFHKDYKLSDTNEKRTYKWFRDIVHEVSDEQRTEALEYLMLLPDLFHLLCKLMNDKDVPKGSKRIVGIAVAYLASPINLVPNLVPGLGLIDDVAICVYALNKIIQTTDKEVINRHWCGRGKLFNIVDDFLEKANDLVGSEMLKKIKNMFF